MFFKRSKILQLNITDSTNIQLKRLAQCGAKHGFVVIANAQTKGKGRYDRTFVSPKNKGIYLSYLMRTNADIADITQITAYAAVAVKRAIKKVCKLNVDIKWVNDLTADGKKLCGILCESATKDAKAEYIIIGIGINVNTDKQEFGQELYEIATSIKEQTNKTQNRKKLIRQVIKQLDKMCLCYCKDAKDYLQEYISACINIGKEITVEANGKVLSGVCKGVSTSCELEILLDDGQKIAVSSGEARILKK